MDKIEPVRESLLEAAKAAAERVKADMGEGTASALAELLRASAEAFRVAAETKNL